MFDFSSIKNRMQGTQLLEHGVFFSANPVAGIKVFIKMLTEAERKRLAQIFFEKKLIGWRYHYIFYNREKSLT
jgi:hypothetical protein